MSKDNIVIATIKPWNIENANTFITEYCDVCDVVCITKKEELTFEAIRHVNPRYIFFPHWSWIIPEEIFANFECVVFHMTDLPYGRGGSPLQNLVLNKIYNTKISAIKVGKELDAGDVYLKEDFYIGLGRAEEIFEKTSEVIFFKMIPYILKHQPIPSPQVGEIVTFKRRKPFQSNVSNANINTLTEFYDFIRMLDAKEYPKAFCKIGDFKIEFNRATKKLGKVIGNFQITREEE